ncbi:MAG: N-acetylglucosamine-6-phosphate deacetylase [Kiritimatiellae bacterium]|nr:N-acetylglucosamine-6-phosphate deacetylase [Kiritimatiellia bacterium]
MAVSFLLRNAKVLAPTGVIARGAVSVSKDGTIAYAGSEEGAPRGHDRSMDMGGRLLAPGFIDLHVHGGNGVAFGAGSLDENLQAYARWVVRSGVTGFLCSIAAPTPDDLVRMISAYAEILDRGLDGAECLGLHLEGPFMNPVRKGACNAQWLHPPSPEEADRYVRAGRGWIRQVTMAPELPGASETADRFRAAGVVVALGHTDADYETAAHALRGAFTHVTHAFNAQRGFAHREPGVVGAVLASDGVTAELVADGIHVHPGAMKILCRCLGTERVVPITDAMSAAGLSDGVYEVWGGKATVRSGKAALENGTIAGGVGLMNRCVRGLAEAIGAPLHTAVRMASRNPASVLGLDKRLGSLSVGMDASLVALDEDGEVHLTMVKGTVSFAR